VPRFRPRATVHDIRLCSVVLTSLFINLFKVNIIEVFV